jgi:hypothetical protein
MPDVRILARRLLVVETKLKKHESGANVVSLNILGIEPLAAAQRSIAVRLKVGRFHRK